MDEIEDLSGAEFQSALAVVKDSPNLAVAFVNSYVKAQAPYKKLFRLSNAKNVSISKDARLVTFEEPVFLSRVDVLGDSPVDLSKSLSLSAIGQDGSRFDLSSKVSQFTRNDGAKFSAASFQVGVLVSALELRSKKPYFALRATSFRLVGYPLSQMENAASEVVAANSLIQRIDRFVEEKRAKVDEHEERQLELEESLRALGEELAELESTRDERLLEKGKLEVAVAELKAKQDSASSLLKDSNSRIEMARGNEAGLRETVANLNRDISKNKAELDRLLNDRNVISDEYKDYVGEGKRQSTVYIGMVVVCISVIGFSAWQIYVGAQRILEESFSSTLDIYAAFIQRVPFAAALGFIAAVAWRVAKLFVERIITIHSQRLALARLLVIAKDTVFSSAAGLDVSDAQRFRERIRLKLAMLKAHLTSELGRDFEYLDEPDSALVGSAEESGSDSEEGVEVEAENKVPA